MLSAAQELAERGWRVFPCQPKGLKAKAPLLQHGHLDATDDLATITSWWTRWPHAMIGAPVPEALLVLDIDPRNGGSIEALEELVGSLPYTLTAWSGRDDGGKHLYFLRPAGPPDKHETPQRNRPQGERVRHPAAIDSPRERQAVQVGGAGPCTAASPVVGTPTARSSPSLSKRHRNVKRIGRATDPPGPISQERRAQSRPVLGGVPRL